MQEESFPASQATAASYDLSQVAEQMAAGLVEPELLLSAPPLVRLDLAPDLPVLPVSFNAQMGLSGEMFSPPAAKCLPRPLVRGTPCASTPLAAIALAALGSAPVWSIKPSRPLPCDLPSPPSGLQLIWPRQPYLW